MYAILCDSTGKPLLGSDGNIWIDKRYGKARIRQTVSEYRERFRAHFPDKYAYWTHFGIVPSLRDNPTTVTPI